MAEIDVGRVRKHTAGCENVVHFNNAGSALPPDCVHEAVANHLECERMMGGYEAQAAAAEHLDSLYTGLATLLNARPHEIAFVDNATRAWDMAFYALSWAAGDRILTSETEYASNFMAFLQMGRRRGVEVMVAPSDHAGQVDVAALESMIDERVKLIAITHVPSHTGVVTPVTAIGAVARKYGVPYLLDACQSAGHLPIDVQAIGCDMLSGTGRKYLRGPRGTGFLYVRESMIAKLEPPFIDLQAATWTGPGSYELRSDARRFETWEGFIAGRLGLARAVDYALDLGVEEIAGRVRSLATRLRSALSDVPGLILRDPGPEALCGIVTFTQDGREPADVVDRLHRHRINVSHSPASHARLDLGRRGLPAVVRASLHYFNVEAEIEKLCSVLASDT